MSFSVLTAILNLSIFFLFWKVVHLLSIRFLEMSTGSILLFCLHYVSYSVFTCSCSHLLFCSLNILLACLSMWSQSDTLSANRFHPDHLQEFLTQKKKKSEGWKCDVSSLPCYLFDLFHALHPKTILQLLVSILSWCCFCRSVTSPSVVAHIWRSTWSYIHRTSPSSVPTVMTTLSHDLLGWSTKKNSI